MFNSLIDRYHNSEKIKENKIECLHKLHSNMAVVKQLSRLINEDSIIDSFHLTKDGIFVELNESRGKTKLFFNEDMPTDIPLHIMLNYDYEKNETETALSIISDIMNDSFVMFDIGSNVGWYSLLVKNIFNNATVYSFEPSPLTYLALKNNMKLNGYSTENLFNIGLFDKESKLEFFFNKERPGSSSLKKLFDTKDFEKILIDVEPLDDFADNLNIDNVDFIKCDVEGAEYFVYKGGVKLLTKTKPIIFSEMLRKWSAKFDYTPNDIIKFLGNIGYECFAISGSKQLRYCPEVTVETLETNYYFLHKEKHKKIIEKYVE